MLSRVCVLVSCAVCALPLAWANEVRVWQATGTYTMPPGEQSVIITSPGTFKIEATDGSGGLGYIRKIDVAFTGHPGDVTVYVVRDPLEVGGAEDEPGAAEVWAIDLSACENAETTGTVAELRTTGNYGHVTEGDTLHASGGGTIAVGGNVVNSIDITGSITAPVNIAGQLQADFICESAGDISIGYGGEVNIRIGRMCISDAYGGTLELGQASGSSTHGAPGPRPPTCSHWTRCWTEQPKRLQKPV